MIQVKRQDQRYKFARHQHTDNNGPKLDERDPQSLQARARLYPQVMEVGVNGKRT